MTLLVIASGLYRRLAQHMRGYAECQARQIFRDLVDMPADVTITESEVQVRFHRRAHLPIIAASGLLDQPSVTVALKCGTTTHDRDHRAPAGGLPPFLSLDHRTRTRLPFISPIISIRTRKKYGLACSRL